VDRPKPVILMNLPGFLPVVFLGSQRFVGLVNQLDVLLPVRGVVSHAILHAKLGVSNVRFQMFLPVVRVRFVRLATPVRRHVKGHVKPASFVRRFARPVSTVRVFVSFAKHAKLIVV